MSDGQEDMVNHPAHYNQGGIECIDALESCMTQEEFTGFLRGNAMKYLWRFRHKGGEQDLLKAEYYQERLLLHTRKSFNATEET